MNSLLQRINSNKLKIKIEAKLTAKIINSKKKIELNKSKPDEKVEIETKFIII